MPSLSFQDFTITPNCSSTCCFSGANNKIHEVLRGKAHPYDIIIEGREYLLLNKDKEIVLASETFQGAKADILEYTHKRLSDVFNDHEFVFWSGLVDMAMLSNSCIELRASEGSQVHKILVKAVWNDDEVHGCLLVRFPYSDVRNANV